ncbi:DUF6759 domain-containing protein [Chryseobacterium foetidum]|uniref:DUF6759 domain-containing protein n=1 Tax=Chryseobacterium foetidum TaxID=2951057 RepID=UPI0021C77FFC|nr:DUF6759 domain-containing protein [Chryseobacterium foetidum]
MKKIFLILFVCLFSLGFAQKKKSKSKAKAVAEKETLIIYTEQDAEISNEARIIAGFLKQNPGHEKTEYFKRKLIGIIMADNSPEAKPTITPMSKEKVEKITKSQDLGSKSVASNSAPKRTVNYASVGSKKAGTSEEHKRTADYLSHIFNQDDSDPTAYINIKNRSKCNLIVKITGKKYYNLNVPANGQNYVQVDKGEYVLTTMVCDAKYSSLKRIAKDIELELSVSD